MEIAYRRSCPCTLFPLTYGIMVGGYAFTIGIGCCGGLFFLKNRLMTNSTGPLRTPIQTPLWAKYWSLVARTGALPWGSPQRSPPRSPVGGSFWCSGTFCCYRPGPHRIFLKMYGRYWLFEKGFCSRRGLETCRYSSTYRIRTVCLFISKDYL